MEYTKTHSWPPLQRALKSVKSCEALRALPKRDSILRWVNVTGGSDNPLARPILKVGLHWKGEGPPRRPQRRLGKRLEEVAKAVGGGYCRLQMPLRLALGGCRVFLCFPALFFLGKRVFFHTRLTPNKKTSVEK